MEVHDFVARYPRLYHLAHAAAWPGLQRYGLLSTSALVKLFQSPDAVALVSHQRLDSVLLEDPAVGSAVLRDQRPLNMSKLASALTDDTSVEEWLTLLNGMAFLFPTPRTLDVMLKVYGHEPVVVLTVDTASLVKEYEPSIRLAAINTGSVLYRPAPRGVNTFVGIRRFDHSKKTVKEVAIRHGVPDLLDHLVRADRRLPDGTSEQLTL